VKRIRDFIASIPPYSLDPSAWKGKGWTDLGPQSIQSRPCWSRIRNCSFTPNIHAQQYFGIMVCFVCVSPCLNPRFLRCPTCQVLLHTKTLCCARRTT
jgi:hypothetical protein